MGVDWVALDSCYRGAPLLELHALRSADPAAQSFRPDDQTHPRILNLALPQANKDAAETEAKTQSSHVKRVLAERQKNAKIDPLLETQFQAGRLYAAISSRPGQSGRADGYILEGKELEFYLRR